MKISLQQSFSFNLYFAKATTIVIDMLLQVYLQFWHGNGYVVTSDVIMFFAHYWTIEY